MRVPALTLKQPWASAVAHGLKPIENRVWKPPEALLGKRILLHAGGRWRPDGLPRGGAHLGWDYDAYERVAEHWPALRGAEALEDARVLCPGGAILGWFYVAGWIDRDDGTTRGLDRAYALRGRLEAAGLVDRWWFRNQFGWLLEEVVRLHYPIRCSGARRIWYLDGSKDRYTGAAALLQLEDVSADRTTTSW